jgi:hypothetical protein
MYLGVGECLELGGGWTLVTGG